MNLKGMCSVSLRGKFLRFFEGERFFHSIEMHSFETKTVSNTSTNSLIQPCMMIQKIMKTEESQDVGGFLLLSVFVFPHEIYYLPCQLSISDESVDFCLCFIFIFNFPISCYFFLLLLPSHQVAIFLMTQYKSCNDSSLPAIWLLTSTCVSPFTCNCTS